MNYQNTKQFLRKLLSSFERKIFPFSPLPSMGFQISLFKFHKNGLSERLLEVKAVTRWDILTEQTAVSHNASFQFLPEDISFCTIALYGLPNITLQIPQNRLTEKLLEKKAVSLWDELPEHKTVSQKVSFQFLTEDISFFILSLYGLPNITLQIAQEQS